jgi:hypothetical protein
VPQSSQLTAVDIDVLNGDQLHQGDLDWDALLFWAPRVGAGEGLLHALPREVETTATGLT